jgi:hypothetical protein
MKITSPEISVEVIFFSSYLSGYKILLELAPSGTAVADAFEMDIITVPAPGPDFRLLQEDELKEMQLFLESVLSDFQV